MKIKRPAFEGINWRDKILLSISELEKPAREVVVELSGREARQLGNLLEGLARRVLEERRL